MSEDPRLDTLASLLEEKQQRGEFVTVEQLCSDCPDLVPALRQRIEASENVSPVPQTLAPASGSPIPPEPPVPLTLDEPPAEVVHPADSVIRAAGVPGSGTIPPPGSALRPS